MLRSRKNFSDDFFTRVAGKRLIVSGAGAVARGAYEAGAGLVLTYPGSPVVETFDLLAGVKSPLADRCRVVINEHVAFHQALGYSLSGGRSLVVMKHVGLNVASDPAHYSAYTGINGGMVIVLGTDPGAACSTGEFDSRFFSLHTHLPLFEPKNFAETVEVTRGAFEFSEKMKLPVVICIPSGFCYGVGTAEAGKVARPKKDLFFQNSPDYTCVGARAVERHRLLSDKISFLEDSHPAKIAGFPRASYDRAASGATLVVTSGVHYDMVREIVGGLGVASVVSLFAPVMTCPINSRELGAALSAPGLENVVFVEPLEGLLELQISSFIARSGGSFRIFGKNVFKNHGELTYQAVLDGLRTLFAQKSIGLKINAKEEFSQTTRRAGKNACLEPVFREGTFCPGCPHRAFFYALTKSLGKDDVIGGDIGCSSLPPHFSSWLTCMNSGVSIASGVALAADPKRQKVVSLIGDSTFFHSGIQTIVECVQTDSDQVCFILDNGWTAMTGHQKTPSTRRSLDGKANERAIEIRKLLEAAGVKRIHELDPYRVKSFAIALKKIFDSGPGFRVVIVSRECRLQEARRKEKKPWAESYFISPERCRECGECYSVLTCPAILKGDDGKMYIEKSLCADCSVCRSVCPNGAVAKVGVRLDD